jgi:hypothetical protein
MMKGIVMSKFNHRNDWWDWGVILLLIAGGTIVLWASVWVAHSRAGAPRNAGMHAQASVGTISRDGS